MSPDPGRRLDFIMRKRSSGHILAPDRVPRSAIFSYLVFLPSAFFDYMVATLRCVCVSSFFCEFKKKWKAKNESSPQETLYTLYNKRTGGLMIRMFCRSIWLFPNRFVRENGFSSSRVSPGQKLMFRNSRIYLRTFFPS